MENETDLANPAEKLVLLTNVLPGRAEAQAFFSRTMLYRIELTREDVKKVNDKIPVLGSVPIIGRLFRSKGESTQKRNLLIFVTANLVNPGGTLTKHTAAGTTATGMK